MLLHWFPSFVSIFLWFSSSNSAAYNSTASAVQAHAAGPWKNFPPGPGYVNMEENPPAGHANASTPQPRADVGATGNAPADSSREASIASHLAMLTAQMSSMQKALAALIPIWGSTNARPALATNASPSKPAEIPPAVFNEIAPTSMGTAPRGLQSLVMRPPDQHVQDKTSVGAYVFSPNHTSKSVGPSSQGNGRGK